MNIAQSSSYYSPIQCILSIQHPSRSRAGDGDSLSQWTPHLLNTHGIGVDGGGLGVKGDMFRDCLQVAQAKKRLPSPSFTETPKQDDDGDQHMQLQQQRTSTASSKSEAVGEQGNERQEAALVSPRRLQKLLNYEIIARHKSYYQRQRQRAARLLL